MASPTSTNPNDLVAGLPALIPAQVAADHLNVSTRTLRNWIRAGRLQSIRTNPSGSGRVMIARSELARLIESMIESNPFID